MSGYFSRLRRLTGLTTPRDPAGGVAFPGREASVVEPIHVEETRVIESGPERGASTAPGEIVGPFGAEPIHVEETHGIASWAHGEAAAFPGESVEPLGPAAHPGDVDGRLPRKESTLEGDEPEALSRPEIESDAPVTGDAAIFPKMRGADVEARIETSFHDSIPSSDSAPREAVGKRAPEEPDGMNVEAFRAPLRPGSEAAAEPLADHASSAPAPRKDALFPRTYREVRSWVSETPGEEAPEPRAIPTGVIAITDSGGTSPSPGDAAEHLMASHRRPALPPADPAPEMHDFQLSIGSIHVTVESDPPAPQPAAPARTESIPAPSREPTSSRLERHYIRVR